MWFVFVDFPTLHAHAHFTDESQEERLSSCILMPRQELPSGLNLIPVCPWCLCFASWLTRNTFRDAHTLLIEAPVGFMSLNLSFSSQPQFTGVTRKNKSHRCEPSWGSRSSAHQHMLIDTHISCGNKHENGLVNPKWFYGDHIGSIKEMYYVNKTTCHQFVATSRS